MTNTAQFPLAELTARHERCRLLMDAFAPEAGGLMVFNRVNIYYLSGSLCNGIFWLPKEGEPVLLARKSLERTKAESPLANTVEYRSYGDIQGLIEGFGGSFPEVIAAEQWSLPWAMADMLRKRLSGVRFVSADTLLGRLRAVKSPYELERMREAGARHHKALAEMLPARIRPGMSELEIAREAYAVFLSAGHAGQLRMQGYGEESAGGPTSVGTNSINPTHYNGPTGFRGEHPAAPFMGSADSVWEKHSLLCLDASFSWQGYHSDITQVYFAGKASEIPDLVRRAQDVCLRVEREVSARMRPGALPSELYELSLEVAAKGGFAEGFMGLGGNKVPFLGHGIGLFLDEWPVLARKFDDPLETGITLAMEPKIGVSGYGLTGSENGWEITSTGAKSLTGPPREIICIE